jgi:glutamine amidotransferase
MRNKSSLKISIIDYRMSNLFSVQQACENVGLSAIITSEKKDILDADGIILPGVGAFGEAMLNLGELDLIEPLKDYIKSGKPFFGVCLGMQLLMSESDEFGIHRGLDIIKGRVIKFSGNSKEGMKIKVPQIGLNQIWRPEHAQWDSTPLQGIANGEFMYFVHSYYVLPDNMGDALSITGYEGFNYCSSLMRDNIFAAQFHPEKSAGNGLEIYRNWAVHLNKQ